MSLVPKEKELMKYYCKTCTIIIGIMEQIGTVVDPIPEVLSSSMETKEKYRSKWLGAYDFNFYYYNWFFFCLGFFRQNGSRPEARVHFNRLRVWHSQRPKSWKDFQVSLGTSMYIPKFPTSSALRRFMGKSWLISWHTRWILFSHFANKAICKCLMY